MIPGKLIPIGGKGTFDRHDIIDHGWDTIVKKMTLKVRVRSSQLLKCLTAIFFNPIKVVSIVDML
jgi:hypothetical protein